MMMVSLLLMVGCATESTDISNDIENEDILTISGLANGDVDITVEEIMGYEQVTDDVIAVDSAGKEESYSVKGSLLSDVLTDYNVSQNDLHAIRLLAGDGYQIEVPSEVLKARDIILAYEINGEQLDEKTKPLRAVVPDERAMYWVRNLIKIEILQATASESISKVIFMNTAFQQLPKEDYTYYESVDEAVKIIDLLTQNEIDSTNIETVTFKASDGLEKNETGDIFVNSYFKFSGDDAPLFLSPEMPKGMYIKNILFCRVSNTAFVNEKGALDVFPNSETDVSDLNIKALFSGLNVIQSDIYTLEDLGGNSYEVSAAELNAAVITIDSEGGLNIELNSNGENQIVKDLLKIEAK